MDFHLDLTLSFDSYLDVIVTLGAYLTIIMMETDLLDLSAMLLAEQVNVLLWCFFLGLKVITEVVLNLLPSSSMSSLVRTFLTTTWPSPSCQ